MGAAEWTEVRARRRTNSAPQVPQVSAEQLAKMQGREWSVVPPVYNYCRFCQNNGLAVAAYSTHVTKDAAGTVQCPVLRNYVCPTCEATGDRAHTARYCPYREGEGRGRRRSEGREEVAAAVMALLPTPMAGHIINMRNNLRRERGEL